MLFLLEGYGSLLFCWFALVCGIVWIVLSICVALDLSLDCSDGLVLIVRIWFLIVYIASYNCLDVLHCVYVLMV